MIWKITFWCIIILLEETKTFLGLTLGQPGGTTVGKEFSDTRLVCDVGTTFDSSKNHFWTFENIVLTVSLPEHSEETGTNSFSLVIHNTSLSDEGTYKCDYDFMSPSGTTFLEIDCLTPQTVVMAKPEDDHTEINVTGLCTQNASIAVESNLESDPIVMNLENNVTESTGRNMFGWRSSSNLKRGTHQLEVTITTFSTQNFPRTVKIVCPCKCDAMTAVVVLFILLGVLIMIIIFVLLNKDICKSNLWALIPLVVLVIGLIVIIIVFFVHSEHYPNICFKNHCCWSPFIAGVVIMPMLIVVWIVLLLLLKHFCKDKQRSYEEGTRKNLPQK